MAPDAASWSRWIPSVPTDGIDSFVLVNAHVPLCTVSGVDGEGLQADHDGLVRVDIVIRDGKVLDISPAGTRDPPSDVRVVDADGGMCWPTFSDIHTHIDKGHTCERSRNHSGSLAGADDSCAKDEAFWSQEDVRRRMEFSLKSAYAHGTSAVRTHIMSGPKQAAIAWPVFHELREKWRGKIELQGVSLSILRFFRDEDAAAELADTVKANGGILGAAVSCTDRGGHADDIYTTCGEELPALLDVIFRLANERGLDLDFHVDENGNEVSKGLLYIAEAATRNDFKGKIVCGHCCSLAAQAPAELARIIAAAHRSNICVVSLPIVNQWLQNRDVRGLCTPTKRGVTTLKELDDAGVQVCLASDNTRDQFYGYGDLDMLEIFRESCRIGHLDRPIANWPMAVTSRPATVMGLGEHHGRVAVGGPANLVVFRGRCYSELLSRPQLDRLVLRDGRPLMDDVPDYRELDVGGEPGANKRRKSLDMDEGAGKRGKGGA
jgi:cytosine/adenosine deaminase-related metal-dependent hydrolase